MALMRLPVAFLTLSDGVWPARQVSVVGAQEPKFPWIPALIGPSMQMALEAGLHGFQAPCPRAGSLYAWNPPA